MLNNIKISQNNDKKKDQGQKQRRLDHVITNVIFSYPFAIDLVH